MAYNIPEVVKILVAGDHGVGKSSIIYRYTTDSYSCDSYRINYRDLAYTSKEVDIQGKKILLQLHEFSEKYSFLWGEVHPDFWGHVRPHGVILTYDISEKETLENLVYWKMDIDTFAEDPEYIVVGNKSDLDKREVTAKMGKEFSLRCEMSFVETSAKSALNIDILFETLTRLVLKKRGVINTIEDSNAAKKDYATPIFIIDNYVTKQDHTTPILVIGDSGVGKTYICQSFKNIFYEGFNISNVTVKTIELIDHNHQHVKLNLEIIDIPGNKISDITTMPHYSRAMGIILVYDITGQPSFDNITRWLHNIEAHSSKNVQCILVGNKLDMEFERQVLKERGEELAGKLKMLFFETSAKKNINIDEAFETLSRQILKEQKVSVFKRITSLFQRKKSFSIDLQKPASSALRIDKQEVVSLNVNEFTEIDQKNLHSALQGESIETSITKVVVQGPARSGKTSVKCLILSQPYESNISTGCVESPQIAIGEFSMSQYGQLNEYRWELVDDEKMIEKFANEVRSLIEEQDLHKDLSYPVLPLKPFISTVVTKKPIVSSSKPKSKLPVINNTATVASPHMSLEPLNQLPTINEAAAKQLSEIINEASTKGVKLTLHKEWLYFIDSGGQIQFQQLLQAFIPCASVLMLVTNLAEDLSSQSSTVLQCEDGKYIVSGHSPTVETLFKRLILMVNSSAQQQQSIIDTELSQVIIKPPEKLKIITIATHRDEYEEQLKKEVETIEEKEKKLAKIFESIEGNLSFHDVTSGKILYEVDGRKASQGVFDDPVIKEIRAELKDQAFKVKIPLRWYAFEILLRQEAIASCGVLSLEECQATGLGLGLHIEEIQSALKFFYLLNTILYYPGVSDLVFVLPHSLIEVVSELMILACKIRNGVSVGPGAVDMKKMADHGFVSKDVFAKSQKCKKISSSFPLFSSEILKIFQHLLIAAELPDSKFFMPALLPLIDPSEVNPVHNSTSCPLLFYFKKGAPIGLFCAMIVHLLSLTHHGRSLWVIDESNSKVYSNYITLRKIGGGKISFIEEQNVFEIHCEFTEDHFEVKKELFRAINETITTRRISKEMEPEIGIYCPCKVEGTHVATVWDEDKWTLFCTSKKDVIRCTRENGSHPCWSWFESTHEIEIEEISANDTSTGADNEVDLSKVLNKIPYKHDLVNLLADVIDVWENIGIVLKVSNGKLQSLRYSYLSEALKHADMLQSWLDERPTPVTWSTVISALDSKIVGKKQTAMEILQFLSQPDVYSKYINADTFEQ